MNNRSLLALVAACLLGMTVSSATSCRGADTLIAQSVGPQGPPGPTGPAGAVGPAGQTGLQGPAGASGVSGYEVIKTTASLGAGPNLNTDLIVSCPAGKKPVGGGVEQSTVPAATVYGLYPGGSLEGPTWHIALTNGSSSPRTVTLYAICIIAN